MRMRLRPRSAGRPGRPAPSWRRTARQASDPRSLRDAVRRLGSAPVELVAGPEPPPLPAGVGWSGRLAAYRTPLHWLAAAAVFVLTVQLLLDNSALWAGLVPVMAALVALPLGLVARTPLRAWWVQVLVAAGTPVLASMTGGWTSEQRSLPWLPTLIFVALYVLFAVSVRLELHLLVGVWLVTGATVWWSYMAAGDRQDLASNSVLTIMLATVVMAYGYLAGTRRRLQHELVEGRAREREEHGRRAVLEERARIARELHDVVAHHMSVIAVRAETAPFRIPGLPDAVKDDMAETSAIAREALTEMRRLLGVLRGADGDADRDPQPGLDRLEGLVAAVRGAGLAVDLELTGGQRRLPPAVELSAYRIVQEALSNALRHAPAAAATVGVRYEPDRLRLRVESQPPGADRGRSPRPASAGQGIVGMRERAAMLGGTLAAEPTPEGGYLVEAVLPLQAERP